VLRSKTVVDGGDDARRSRREGAADAVVGLEAADDPAASVEVDEHREGPGAGGLVDANSQRTAGGAGKRLLDDRADLVERAEEARGGGVHAAPQLVDRGLAGRGSAEGSHAFEVRRAVVVERHASIFP
jgi:hypothetical protein